MAKNKTSSTHTVKSDERKRRLAEALRENLKKRKTQPPKEKE